LVNVKIAKITATLGRIVVIQHLTPLPNKYVLCSGDHPVNYQDCNVYKELQRRKTLTTKSDFLHDTIKPNVKPYNVKESHPLATLSEKNEFNLSKTYAQTTANQPPQPSPPSDLTQLMSSFVGELKSLINPLIALLTQVITSLLNKNNELLH